jgi:hypothetical protein
MDRSGASAYVYAKASGMLARSFVGPRAARLFEVKTIPELWALLFKTEVPLVPENILAQVLEQKAEEQFISDFTNLLMVYSKPDPVSVHLLRSYAYNDLKDAASALRDGNKNTPEVHNLGEYGVFNWKAWPDIARITAESPAAWYDRVPTEQEEMEWETRLDIQYMRSLWETVKKLPLADRIPAQELLLEDIRLDNINWAMRLRIYYGMSAEEIAVKLAGEQDIPDKDDVLAGPAIRMLNFVPDNYADWEKWQYASLLNPHEEGVIWAPDPRWVQQMSYIKLYKLALSRFHRYPFTAGVLISWFKIKQQELRYIRTATEGLRLNIPDSELKDFVGVQ